MHTPVIDMRPPSAGLERAPGRLSGRSIRFLSAGLPVLVFHCDEKDLERARSLTQADIPGLEKLSISGASVHAIVRTQQDTQTWVFRRPRIVTTLDELLLDEGSWQGSAEAMNDLARQRIRLAPGVEMTAESALRLCAESALLNWPLEQDAIDAGRAEVLRSGADLPAQFLGKIFRLIVQGAKPSNGFVALRDMEALNLIIPELAEGQDLSQNRFHEFDIFFHSIFACDAVGEQNLALRLAALLHDVGKSRTRRMGPDGEPTFHNHEVVGARQADRLLKRLGFEPEIVSRVKFLVRNHMFHYTPDWTDYAVRRFMRKVNPDQMKDLIALRIADRKGSGKRAGVPRPVYDFLAHMERLRAEDAKMKVADLTIGGNDLMEAGMKPGPLMGDLLKQLLAEVTAGDLQNEKEALLLRAKALGGIA